MKNKCSSRQ